MGYKRAYPVHFDLPLGLVLDVETDALVEPEEIVLDGGLAVFYHQDA